MVTIHLCFSLPDSKHVTDKWVTRMIYTYCIKTILLEMFLTCKRQKYLIVTHDIFHVCSIFCWRHDEFKRLCAYSFEERSSELKYKKVKKNNFGHVCLVYWGDFKESSKSWLKKKDQTFNSLMKKLSDSIVKKVWQVNVLLSTIWGKIFKNQETSANMLKKKH